MNKQSRSSYFNYNSIPLKTPSSKTSQLSGLDEEVEENKNNPFFPNLKPLVSAVSKSPLLSLVVLITVIVFGSGFITKIDKSIFTVPKLQNEKLTNQDPSFTRAEYERLKLGMLLVEVEAILGRGFETEQAAKTVTFVWNNPDKSAITGVFEDGKLVHKKQEGL